MVLSTWHQCTYHKFTQRLLTDIIGASNCFVGRTSRSSAHGTMRLHDNIIALRIMTLFTSTYKKAENYLLGEGC